MKGFIAFLLILIVAGLGYLIWDREVEKRRLLAASHANAAKLAVEEQRALERARHVENAILRGEVLVGMSRYEARKAWGYEYDVEKHDLTAADRHRGIYERWRYQDPNKGVLSMTLNGTVLEVSLYEGAESPQRFSESHRSIRSAAHLTATEIELVGTYAVSATPADSNILLQLEADRSSAMIYKNGEQASLATDGVWSADSSMLWIIGSTGTEIRFLRLDRDLRLISVGGNALQETPILRRMPDMAKTRSNPR